LASTPAQYLIEHEVERLIAAALLRTVSTGIVGSVMIAALQRDRSDPDRLLAYPFELAYFANHGAK
jgi:hypothetical protein